MNTILAKKTVSFLELALNIIRRAIFAVKAGMTPDIKKINGKIFCLSIDKELDPRITYEHWPLGDEESFGMLDLRELKEEVTFDI